MIRVGRRIYDRYGKYVDPYYENFISIISLTKSTEYGCIGPYVLKDDKNRIMENIWQGSKVYKYVPETELHYSRYDNKIIWKYPYTNFFDKNNNILPSYWIWRKKVMENQYALRYPAGYENRKKCLYALSENDINKPLDYIESRKQIYVPIYCNMVKKEKKYMELKEKLKDGKNLLIIEVDGPHEESMDYYKEKYNVSDNFIENSTMFINKENIQIMLNDEKHPFGHGYCLALALLDKDIEWVK